MYVCMYVYIYIYIYIMYICIGISPTEKSGTRVAEKSFLVFPE